ncbi:GTPase family protein [Butyrivibrio sp. YAB3001]|uniref:GTPase family protein n=1 Tax=Butyrivibrio sp. YAB3001 TaxID=1520812 RepID=UPI0008F6329B|nr:GTPase [Butyrivibrio sp. YAB3001]SFB66450.1 hypothetical protein SAMN02910398_00003 [Butyrivibrio sp. YAB3001]
MNNSNENLTTHNGIFSRINEILLECNASEYEKQKFMRHLMEAKNQHLGLMIVGPTGVGKTSTIDALLGVEKAKIGTGTSPETMEIAEYDFEGITIYDTPGFGDGTDADKRHAEDITKLLQDTNEKGEPIIDLVLILIDGTSRDIGTTINLINHLLIHHFKDEPGRLLIAVNKADRAIPVGNHWDYEANKPDEAIVKRMDETVKTIRERIYTSTGINVDPIWYCAGGKEEGGEKYPAYNVSKLLSYIVSATPKEKRVVFLGNINTEETDYLYDDGAKNYNKETASSIWESILTCASIGAGIGASIGAFGGPVAAAIGAAIGAGLGAIGRWACSLL